MILRASALYDQEVVCIKDGTKLGNIGDVEVNTDTGSAEAVIIYGRARLFGLLGREDDLVIPWSCVEVFGDDLVLVHYEAQMPRRRRSSRAISRFFDF